MQERSYTLPMCSLERTSHVPSTIENFSIDTHLSSSSAIISNESESGIETSTPELNLLLDKLTEILRFRSGCRRHFATIQQQQSQTSDASTSNLKRLQSGSIEPLHNANNISSVVLNASSGCTGAWKSLNMHHKSSNSSRSSHHYHHHHKHYLNHLEKKRRLPCLLQRLLDEGNLIKEAVRRLKSQRFSHTFKQSSSSNVVNTPSTPTTKTLIEPQANISSRLPPSSLSIPQQNNDSPNRAISWFLSSSVFGVNASTTHPNSGSRSPLRTCYASTTHERASMEIGIHDG